MSKKSRISLDQLGRKLKSKVSREFLTYLVFLLIAVVIWYLNALNKDYTTDLEFKVKYTDLPEDKVLVTPPPDRLVLTIKAQGNTLLKYRLGLIFYPITLDANYHTLRKRHSSVPGQYFIATQSVFDKIASQLSSDVKLNHIMPDTLNFHFSETVQKDIPVKVLLHLQFDKGFLPRGDMQVNPKNVTVVGPQAIIDTMQHVYTREKTFKKLNDTLRTELSLQPVQQLRYSVSEVSIMQAIERCTEATVVVPIESVNLPEGLTMKTFPGTITVNCMVPMIDFEKLQPYMFRAVVDYITIKDAKDKQTKVKVNLLRSPDYVSDVRFHPKNVDFIVEK